MRGGRREHHGDGDRAVERCCVEPLEEELQETGVAGRVDRGGHDQQVGSTDQLHRPVHPIHAGGNTRGSEGAQVHDRRQLRVGDQSRRNHPRHLAGPGTPHGMAHQDHDVTVQLSGRRHTTTLSSTCCIYLVTYLTY